MRILFYALTGDPCPLTRDDSPPAANAVTLRQTKGGSANSPWTRLQASLARLIYHKIYPKLKTVCLVKALLLAVSFFMICFFIGWHEIRGGWLALTSKPVWDGLFFIIYGASLPM